MHSLDSDKPDKVRQDAQERVSRALREERRARYTLVAVVLVIGALLGFGAGLLVADRWAGGREVIFIPASGVEV